MFGTMTSNEKYGNVLQSLYWSEKFFLIKTKMSSSVNGLLCYYANVVNFIWSVPFLKTKYAVKLQENNLNNLNLIKELVCNLQCLLIAMKLQDKTIFYIELEKNNKDVIL